MWIELGLQTIHEKSATLIRRGYSFDCFHQTATLLQQYKIPFIVHLIIGLPNETPAEIYESVLAMNYYKPFGLKLQLLHVLKDTDLATYYLQGNFKILTQEEYIEIIIHCLEILSPDIVIHRLTGDGPKNLLLAPMWSTNKRQILNQLHHNMKLLSKYKGRLFECCKTH